MLVEGGGFEPPKADPFGRSGTPPMISFLLCLIDMHVSSTIWTLVAEDLALLMEAILLVLLLAATMVMTCKLERP